MHFSVILDAPTPFHLPVLQNIILPGRRLFPYLVSKKSDKSQRKLYFRDYESGKYFSWSHFKSIKKKLESDGMTKMPTIN